MISSTFDSVKFVQLYLDRLTRSHDPSASDGYNV